MGYPHDAPPASCDLYWYESPYDFDVSAYDVNFFRIVRLTTGYDDESRQLRQVLGYYSTRKAALEALASYSENPYDINASKLTFSQLYDKWSEEKYNELSQSAIRTYKSAYSYCKPLYDIRIADIKTPQMQDIVDYADVGATTRARIQNLFR